MNPAYIPTSFAPLRKSASPSGSKGNVGTFIYLMPAFGALLAFVFLGEGLQMYQLAGGAAIFAGIAILNWKRSAQ